MEPTWKTILVNWGNKRKKEPDPWNAASSLYQKSMAKKLDEQMTDSSYEKQKKLLTEIIKADEKDGMYDEN